MSDELKPCPFCGGPVSLGRTIDGRKWWGVVCRNTVNLGGTCAIQQRPSATKSAAIDRWNRRAPVAASPAIGGDDKAMREAFETWFSDNGACMRAILRVEDGSYAAMKTDAAWEGWKAALAWQASQGAAVESAASPATRASDAADGTRYRAIRDAAVRGNASFLDVLEAHFPADVRLGRRYPTTDEWDAASDAAIAAQQESGNG